MRFHSPYSAIFMFPGHMGIGANLACVRGHLQRPCYGLHVDRYKLVAVSSCELAEFRRHAIEEATLHATLNPSLANCPQQPVGSPCGEGATGSVAANEIRTLSNDRGIAHKERHWNALQLKNEELRERPDDAMQRLVAKGAIEKIALAGGRQARDTVASINLEMAAAHIVAPVADLPDGDCGGCDIVEGAEMGANTPALGTKFLQCCSDRKPARQPAMA